MKEFFAFEDGKTYCSRDLYRVFGLRSEECFKKWARKHNILKASIGAHWWIDGGDLRRHMKKMADADREARQATIKLLVTEDEEQSRPAARKRISKRSEAA